MHALAVVTLLLTAAPVAPEARALDEGAASIEGERGGPAASAPLTTYVLGASAVALGGAAGVLLSLPLAVPIIYVAALASVPAVAGALPLLLVVPLAAGLGSGGAAFAFTEGVGPWVVGALSGAAAGVTLLAVGAVVAPARPSTVLDLHLGVLSLVGVPSLAAAATAAVALPFFVTGTGGAFE